MGLAGNHGVLSDRFWKCDSKNVVVAPMWYRIVLVKIASRMVTFWFSLGVSAVRGVKYCVTSGIAVSPECAVEV